MKTILRCLLCFSLVLLLICSCAGDKRLSRSLAASETARAALLYGDGQLEKAYQAYLQAFRHDDGNMQCLYELARLSYETDRVEQGLSWASELVQRMPGNLMALELRAYGYVLSEQYGKAADDYRIILEDDPLSSSAVLNLAEVNRRLEQYEDAYQLLFDYAQSFEESGEELGEAFLYRRLADLATLSGKQESESYWIERFFESGGERDADFLIRLGDAYRNEETYRKALGSYEEALPLTDDTEAKALLTFQLARLLLVHLEDYPQGLSYLEQAFDLGFSDQAALKELQNSPDLLDREAVNQLIKKAGQKPGLKDQDSTESTFENTSSGEGDASTSDSSPLF